MRFKKSILLILLGAVFFTAPLTYAADNPDNTVRIEVFERQDCGHCQDEKAFLNQLQKERRDLILIFHDIAEPAHKEHFKQLTELENMPKVTPITIIDSVVLQGFDTAETTGKKIEKLIEATKGKKQYTFEEFIAAGGSKEILAEEGTCDTGDVCEIEPEEYLVSIPFVGAVDVAKYSLPGMALVLGFVDGFNPCAMWVLVLFLTILLEAGSRRRMFEMAGLFIFAEAVMYYLILNVWMTAWDFVGMDRIVTPVVGFVAVAAGLYFLYNFYKADTTCKVGNLNSKRKTAEKIKCYATVPMNIPVALGILGLAFSVNIIEFACSVGIPQTFTKVLDLNYLNFAGKQFYNALYIIMYMIDDLIVFALALYSFDKIGLTTAKYTRFSHFLGGILMVLLGLILLTKPGILVFG
ncbi:glutaredoxin [Patescibacteria group bacterium]|nr:glutaredoxin [Patescibacteria group bacterium]MBU1015939.1 glutaredoxin [Patescibacteria group bacterium]MBU1685498.1 glutaredoxin [Patescibacteria group bacterium]MBU1938692.1 glutaredoxin [Patescibacteria group bacterium]